MRDEPEQGYSNPSEIIYQYLPPVRDGVEGRSLN